MSAKKQVSIRYRMKVEVNTDPQRRCYNGVHAKSGIGWTQWTILDSGVDADQVEFWLNFWRNLNAYAVSQRGEVGTLREYEAVEAVPS